MTRKNFYVFPFLLPTIIRNSLQLIMKPHPPICIILIFVLKFQIKFIFKAF